MTKIQKVITAITIAALFTLIGCTVTKQDDGSMGLKFGIDEVTHAKVQKHIDGASNTLGILSSLFPALTPMAAAAGVGGYTWRRMKKTVTKNKKPLELLVRSLEHIKEIEPKTWEKIRDQIKKEHPTMDIKGTIDEIKSEFYKVA